MDINQIYKAPSIPKLSKRNISSSVLRASSAVSSFRTSRFSFIKPKVGLSEKLESLKPIETLNAEKIFQKKEDRETETYKALVETNRILVEIQKQLSLDFAMRIAEEKESVKKIKAAESKRKFTAKESAVEGVKKIGSIGKNIVDKVTAPVKSIFDKIKEFFGLILTGIVYNAAFNWLQDPNNKKLLDDIFYWIGKSFVPLLIGILGYKLVKWSFKLFKVARWFWRLPGRTLNIFKKLGSLISKIGTFFGIKPRAPVQTGTSKLGTAAIKGLTVAQQSAQRKMAEEVLSKGLKAKGAIVDGKYISVTAEESAKLLKKPNILQRGLQSIGEFGGKLTTKIVQPIINTVLPKLPPKVKDEIAQVVASKGMKRFLPFVNVLFGTVEGITRVLEGDIEGALLSFASAIPFAGWGALALDIYRSVDPKGYQKNIRFGLSKDELEQSLGAAFNTMSPAVGAGFSQGGTVPGSGSGFVDSVKAMLAPGEEVIRSTSAMLFRPLLKDINDNAGRLWATFSQAISKLLSVSESQKTVSQEFSKVIEDFDKYLKDDILKKKTSKPMGGTGGGGVRMSSMTPQPSISPAPRITNISMNVSGGSGGMTFLPMVLPKQSSKPPQIPQMQGKATDVPVISPVNFANPYMELTPELYNIQMMYG